ncbi:MAG: ATP-binding cassette domain-containing protein [Succinivibrio sp.]
MNNSIVSASRLSFSYKSDDGRTIDVFDSFDLSIDRKYSTICLTGPDGAGKSTLMKLLCGVLKPKSGEVYLNARKADSSDDIFVKMQSYMSQTLGLYQELSVIDNLRIFASLKGVDIQKDQNFLYELLEKVDLLRFRDREAGALSGGMKQKLAITCAIAPRPRMLLLDEPTVGIDPLSRLEIWNIIREYTRSNNAYCIFSSAYLEEAQASDYTIMLTKEGIMMQGEPNTLTGSVRSQTFSLLPKRSSSLSLCRKLLQTTVRNDKDSIIADICPVGGKINLLSTQPISCSQITTELAEKAGLTADDYSVAQRSPSLEDLYILNSMKNRSFASPDLKDDKGTQNTDKDSVVISVRDIRKKFGDFTAVDSSSFEVHKGEIFGLLGPNGAGKTTTFRMLCALLSPTEGSIRINGYDLAHAKADARATIGYVSQKFSLYRNMTVRQNLEYFGRSYGLYGKKLKQRIKELLQEFSLTEYSSVKSVELPFGLQRQLSMACALIHKPKILFLDEATSGADPLARRLFWDRVNLLSRSGTSVIVTTHFMDEAEYCDHFLIQDSGKILTLGTPDTICTLNGRRLTIEERFISLVREHREIGL